MLEDLGCGGRAEGGCVETGSLHSELRSLVDTDKGTHLLSRLIEMVLAGMLEIGLLLWVDIGADPGKVDRQAVLETLISLACYDRTRVHTHSPYSNQEIHILGAESRTGLKTSSAHAAPLPGEALLTGPCTSYTRSFVVMTTHALFLGLSPSGQKPNAMPITGAWSIKVYTVCKSLSVGFDMDIETDLKMSSCGGSGRDSTCPEAVPINTSVAGGVTTSCFDPPAASPGPAGPDNGDHATAVITCLIRKGLGRRDCTAGLPGLIGR